MTVCMYVWDGVASHLSFSSDVWSVGLVAMECATGQYPYREAETYIEVHPSLLGHSRGLLGGEVTFAGVASVCVPDV